MHGENSECVQVKFRFLLFLHLIFHRPGVPSAYSGRHPLGHIVTQKGPSHSTATAFSGVGGFSPQSFHSRFIHPSGQLFTVNSLSDGSTNRRPFCTSESKTESKLDFLAFIGHCSVSIFQKFTARFPNRPVQVRGPLLLIWFVDLKKMHFVLDISSSSIHGLYEIQWWRLLEVPTKVSFLVYKRFCKFGKIKLEKFLKKSFETLIIYQSKRPKQKWLQTLFWKYI